MSSIGIGIVLLSAFGYYIISGLSPSQIIAGVIAIASAAYMIYYNKSTQKDIIIKPPSNRREIVSERYSAKRFPDKPGYKYLKHNADLLAILESLKFTRMFNRAGYNDLALYMDKFQKIYMYILSDRYYARSYIDTWLDFKESILEILYGLIFVVPDRMRHSYNIDPYNRINTAKEQFTTIADRMTATLKNYMLNGKGEKYFPENGPKGYESGKDDRLP